MGRMVGRYELVRPLGKGGMAEVFLARRRGPGGVEKRLVVKRIRRERARDPRFLKMFVQEARLSMALAHKNIVPMFDFGRAGDELFLVMEYVDGYDLGALLDRAKQRRVSMAPVLAAYIVMEACQALDYAHGGDHAVVHRDVTPRNVLVSRAGEIKLVDFGVATTETDLGARKVRGTPAYMSPEQACGETVDGRADVFSLGLVLWEMLTGRRAYDATDSKALLEMAKRAEVPALPEDAPEALRASVERATASDPAERFPDARSMQIALDDYVVGARAADLQRRPLALQLAAWVEQLFPAAERAGEQTPVVEPPDGPVVTFLEDGLEEVERVVTLAPGLSTARSIAETMAEPDGDTDADEERAPAPLPAGDVHSLDTAPVRRVAPRNRPRALVAIAALVAIGGAAVAISLSRSSAEGDPDPAPVAVAPWDAAVSPPPARPDAGVAAPVAAVADAAPAPTPDARPRHKRPRPAPPPPPAAAPRRVKVSSQPWAEVTVVGRDERCESTPCTLELPPGNYTLRLHNPVNDWSKQVPVTIDSEQTATVRETLTRPR